MTPFFADAIDIPMVFVAGVIVLIPLMAFEVFIEALVLARIWRLPYGLLCKFTFFANGWSLLAGVPTKILSAFLYSQLLPEDIPGYFTTYPFAAAIGSLIYFLVTLLVEGAYAFAWRRRKQIGLSVGKICLGILLANIATYAVLAPLHYYATRPTTRIREFTRDARWTSHPAAKVLFIDASLGSLKSVQLDGSAGKTIAPMPVTDYLVSTDLSMCLFRGTNGNLYLYRAERGQTDLIWKTDQKFFMDQVAFSPSGDHVAFADEKDNSIEMVDVPSAKRKHLPLVQKFNFNGPSVAWSPEETKFFVRGFDEPLRLAITIDQGGNLITSPLTETNAPALLKCYGRRGSARWHSSESWGVSYDQDACGDLAAVTWPGLDSGLRILHDLGKEKIPALTLSVRPGLLHIAGFYFGDVAFMEDCRECLFEANGYIYLLGINERRVGTLVKGDRFILLTRRYEKSL